MPQLVVQGTKDYITDLRDLAHRYVERAASAGDSVELVELAGVEHLEVVDASTRAWATIAGRLEARMRAGRRMLHAQ